MTDIVNVTGLKCPFQIIEVQKYVREKKSIEWSTSPFKIIN